MLIIHFLKNFCKLYYCNKMIVANRLYINKTPFEIDSESKENMGFIGFFDWLRSDDSNLIGVRCCFFEHHDYNHILSRLPYVTSKFEGKCMEILFDDLTYDADLCADQDFGSNYFYFSKNDGFLVTFSFNYLYTEELESLRKYSLVIDEKDLII